MKINRGGTLYRLAYAFSETKLEKTSLCQFFWRLVFRFVFACLVLTMVACLVAVAVLEPQIIMGFIKIIGLMLVVMAILVIGLAVTVGGVFGILLLFEWLTDGAEKIWGIVIIKMAKVSDRSGASELWRVVTAFAHAKKEKFCPTIEFTVQ